MNTKMPPYRAEEEPEDDAAAAEYFDTHDLSELLREPQPVGVLEIAELAKVRPVTVQKWRERHESFPRPRWTVSGQPAWDWWEVQEWLRHPRPVGRPKAS